MRDQITTTIEAELLKKAKHEAVNKGVNVNDLLEKGLILYFEAEYKNMEVKENEE